MLELNKIHCMNALEGIKQLPRQSIDCVITSPPYWGLRDYGTDPQVWGGIKKCDHVWNEEPSGLQHENRNNITGTQEEARNQTPTAHIKKYDQKNSQTCLICNAWKGELGLEPTPEMFVSHLADIFEGLKNALKPSGTMWVNLGDTYIGGNQGFNQKPPTSQKHETILPKCLAQVPSRFAIEMSRRGWILRNEIIWHKPNAMPSSATDRFTVDFEKVFFFTKYGDYYFEQQIEEKKYPSEKIKNICINISNEAKGIRNGTIYNGKHQGAAPTQATGLQEFILAIRTIGKEHLEKHSLTKEEKKFIVEWTHNASGNPEGRNKRSVWSIPTKSNPEAHFATYPEALVEPMILSGCPTGGGSVGPL